MRTTFQGSARGKAVIGGVVVIIALGWLGRGLGGFATLLAFAVIGIGGWIVVQYNALHHRAQLVREAHANVMAMMKKRSDLLQRLMDVARGYAEHEQGTYLGVAERATVLAEVRALALAYPQLRADATYSRLMDDLNRLENELQRQRETYNGRVRDYNAFRGQVPQALFADKLGFEEAPYFDVVNADELENLPDFGSGNAEMLRTSLQAAGDRLRRISTNAPTADVVAPGTAEPSQE
ncbi:MAG TPA: LemA family protein [Candidatus Limnocylindria bacterium]|nr:LemA family protein [Candidatus Limnocylindria bacterium]